MQTRLWLWLWLGASVACAGTTLSPPQPRRCLGNSCYEFVRLQLSFWEARGWCQAGGGRLAHPSHLAAWPLTGSRHGKGQRWWISLTEPGKGLGGRSRSSGPSSCLPPLPCPGPGRSSATHGISSTELPGRGAAVATRPPPTSCSYLVWASGAVRAGRGSCAQELRFICRFDRGLSDVRQAGMNHSRAPSGHRPWRRDTDAARADDDNADKGDGRDDNKDGDKEDGNDVPQGPTPHHLTPPRPRLTPPPMTHFTVRPTPKVPASPWPGQAVPSATPGSPAPPAGSVLGQFTLSPRALLQSLPAGLAAQAVEDAVLGFGRAVRGIRCLPELQQACHILQRLTEAPPLLSPVAQREAGTSLLHLSSQLLQTPGPCNSSHPAAATATAAATALFQAFSNILMALDSTTGTPGSALQQALEDTLAALPLVQTMLWHSHNTGTPVTVSTPTVATQLSSCGITCLPLSSHRLAQPCPLDVTFPTASVLATFLPAHLDVQLQLTVMALNPFKHLDGTEISSVGGVSLTSAHGALDMHSLQEEIEVGLWREEAAAPVPTCLNLSAQHFHVELNLTSAEDALLVHVQPDAPLPVDLYLGFGHPPNRTHFLSSTTLPGRRSPPRGDGYTWALPPERLWPGPGRYHLMAVVARSPEQGPVGVSVTTATTRCYFWDQRRRAWAAGGCRVGPGSDAGSTRCLCNHLSFFGSSFLVVPRTVRLQDAGQLLARVPGNPVGAALLGSLLLAFGLAGLWAWRSDRADARQAELVLVPDSDPGATARYAVQVHTGLRRGAGATAQVALTLYGAEGRSGPHLLRGPGQRVLRRGGADVFVLGARRRLGELHGLRLWLRGAGAWYVSRVAVAEAGAGRAWLFPGGAWLCAGRPDRVLAAAAPGARTARRRLLRAGLGAALAREHPWLWALARPPPGPWRFPRARRLLGLCALLLGGLALNLLFWRGPAPAPGPGPGPAAELAAAALTALALLPLGLVVPVLARAPPPRARPAPAAPSPRGAAAALPEPAALEALGPRPELAAAARDLLEREREREREQRGPDGAGGSRPLRCSETSVALQAGAGAGAGAGAAAGLLAAAGWAVLGAGSLVAAGYTLLLSLKLERAAAASWVRSAGLSLLQSALVQPLKIAALRLLRSELRPRWLWHEAAGDPQLRRALALLEASPRLELPASRDRSDPVYRPPPPPARRPPRDRARRRYPQLRETVGQALWLAALCALCGAERSPAQPLLARALGPGLRGLGPVREPPAFWAWAERALLPAPDGARPGLLADGPSLLLGAVRLRQVRARPGPRVSCQLPDTAAYGPGWSAPRPRSHPHPWAHRDAGGGYVAELGANASHARRLLRALRDGAWLDGRTCALRLDFTVYNAAAGLLGLAALELRADGLGALVPRAELLPLRLHGGGPGLAWLALGLGLLLLRAARQGRRLWRQRSGYFRDGGNALELGTVLLALAAVGLHVQRGAVRDRLVAEHRRDRGRFVSFSPAAELDAALTHVLAALLALGTARLCGLLRPAPRALRRAWRDGAASALALLLLPLGSALAGTTMLSWRPAASRASASLLRLLAGSGDAAEVRSLDPAPAALLAGCSLASLVCLVLGLVSALPAARQEDAPEPEPEPALVLELELQLLLRDFRSLLGMPHPAPPAAAPP